MGYKRCVITMNIRGFKVSIYTYKRTYSGFIFLSVCICRHFILVIDRILWWYPGHVMIKVVNPPQGHISWW